MLLSELNCALGHIGAVLSYCLVEKILIQHDFRTQGPIGIRGSVIGPTIGASRVGGLPRVG